MKFLVPILVLSMAILLLGQSTVLTKSVVLTGTTKMGAVNIAHPVTINAGGTSGGLSLNQLEDANLYQTDGIATPIILTATNVTLIPTCYVMFGTAQPGNWSCSIFKGGTSVGLPDGATLICNSSTQVNGVTLGAYTSIALNNCPSNLTGNIGDFYWVGVTYTSTTTQLGNTGFQGSCNYSYLTSLHRTNASQSSAAITPWPNPFPATGGFVLGASGCYASYVQLSYTSVNSYDIISLNQTACDDSVQECKGVIPPIQSGHGFGIMAINSGNGGTISTVKTQTNGSNTDTLTQVGCASGSNEQWCFYWIDQATANANGVDCVWTGGTGTSFKTLCMSFEIQGLKTSGAVDKSHFDTAQINANPATSGSTATVSQNHELIIGGDFDTFPQAPNTDVTLTATSFTAPLATFSAGNAPSQDAIFFQEVNTAPAGYNITVTSTAGAGSNNHLPGLMTLKF